uniref:Uncharacterized protein n=1 Tax=Arundo donax TaxID=35708 RepID=A0A0A8Z6Z7_ARUDO
MPTFISFCALFNWSKVIVVICYTFSCVSSSFRNQMYLASTSKTSSSGPVCFGCVLGTLLLILKFIHSYLVPKNRMLRSQLRPYSLLLAFSLCSV